MLTNGRYKSGTLPSGKPRDTITRGLLPLLPRQQWLEPRALDGPGCHLYPLTCPPHPLVSCRIPSVSIGEELRGRELEALREMGVGKATESDRRSSEKYWACRTLEPAQDALGMGSNWFPFLGDRPGARTVLTLHHCPLSLYHRDTDISKPQGH